MINLKLEAFVFILCDNATHWTNSVSHGTIAVSSVDQLI